MKPLSRRAPLPLESFDPRFREVFTKALLTPYIIPFPTYAEAKRFQVRLHQFRSALRREDPETASILYRVKTSIRDRDLHIHPADMEFSPIFDQVSPPPNEAFVSRAPREPFDAPPTYVPEASGATEHVSFTDLLSDLTKLEDK